MSDGDEDDEGVFTVWRGGWVAAKQSARGPGRRGRDVHPRGNIHVETRFSWHTASPENIIE